MTIEEYFGDWSAVVDLKEARRMAEYLASQKAVVCPEVKNLFRAFRLCPLHSLRAVLLGQDPYNDMSGGKPVATGIAFANSSDTPLKSYSPSLEVLRESVIDFTSPHGTINFDPCLEKWEEQGVLLLNTALSCVKGSAGSHALLWRPFMKSLLTNLSRHTTGIVYVLMGSAAQSFESCIRGFNHVIRIRHPAWYARNKVRMPSDTWRQVNEILVSQNGYGIEWYGEQ